MKIGYLKSIIINLLTQSRQIVKFTFVGAFCLGINTLILYFLIEVAYFHYLISTIIGFFLSNLVGFFLNKYYTFQAIKTNVFKELYKYYTVMTSSFLANLCFMVILVDLFKIWAIYASLLVAVILYIYNYLMHRNWSFKIKRANQKLKIR
jgi:putative flippase GtrA